MMATSDTEYEREKWIQSNWPIYDIKGKINAYVSTGEHINLYKYQWEAVERVRF